MKSPSEVDRGRTTEALEHELERERDARQTAIADADRSRRYAEAIDRLSTAVIAAAGVDELLRKLLELFVDVAGVDAVVIRLREDDRLRSRVAVGLEDEVTAGFSVPVDPHLAGRDSSHDGSVLVSGTDDGCFGESFRQKGMRAAYCLPLFDRQELVGAVYMAARAAREFSEEQTHLLRVLATRAAAAIVHHTAQAALHEAILSRDEVLAFVAHDLRNPLNVIAVAANSLHLRLPNPASRRPVERIIRAAQRADHLITDLLEVNAIEGGRFAIERRRIEPAKTLFSVIESQQSLAASASLILASDLSPELPAVDADEERILEVLENLIGNAVKFSGAGGSVTVGAAYREREILVWVKDNGAGIAAEQLPHLFDRFWQARKRDRRGAGLGLTICKAIVEAHGGRIWAESTLGVGTTMFFTVPVPPDQVPATSPVALASILMVDDRPENLLSLRAILERPDYRLVAARSGEEALSLALRESFSVALIDIAMPGMDGLEVAVHMKQLERSRDIPIIFITAFGDDPKEIHRAYSAGGVDYLVKPLDPEIVRKKVAVFVDLNRRRNHADVAADDAENRGVQDGEDTPD